MVQLRYYNVYHNDPFSLDVHAVIFYILQDEHCDVSTVYRWSSAVMESTGYVKTYIRLRLSAIVSCEFGKILF